MKYVSKIVNVLQQDGIFVLFRKIFHRIKLILVPYFDIFDRIKLILVPYFDYWFDLKYGVDTCRIMVHGDESDIGSDEKKAAIRYEPTPVNALRSILKQLPINHSEFTFIDYGSGKGRALLLASEHPFKKIIGIELSKKLHECAENNIKKWKCNNQKCTDIKLWNANATQFKLPIDPLIIFFFTPFFGDVKDLVIRNIQESFNDSPRPLHIVYYGSRPDFIETLSDMNTSQHEIYSKRPLSAIGKYKGHLFSFNTINTA
jgi:hypothetical protein